MLKPINVQRVIISYEDYRKETHESELEINYSDEIATRWLEACAERSGVPL